MGNYKRGPGNYKSSYLQTVVKKVDQSITNETTHQPDTELKLPLRANTSYGWELVFMVDAASVADIKMNITGPPNYAGEKTSITYNSSFPQATTSLVTNEQGSTTGLVQIWMFYGRIITDLAGDIQVNWAQVTSSASATKVLQGSWLQVMQS